MMRKIFIACVAASMAALFACQSSKTVKATLSDLKGEWNIVSVDGEDVTVPEDQDAPFIGFDTTEGQLYGNASCNYLMGSFDINAAPGVIDFSGMASTRRMCPDMALEQKILEAFGQVKSYSLTADGDIQLSNADGKAVMLLEKRDPQVSARELNGVWNVKTLADTPVESLEGKPYQFTFNLNDMTFFVTTDCNNLSGQFKSEANELEFFSVTATMMACENMAFEDNIKTVINDVSTFKITSDTLLTLFNKENIPVVTMVKESSL